MDNTQDIKTNNDIKQANDIKRVCKDCNNIKILELEFPQNRNKKTVSYRHICIECEKVAKKAQNKKYYQTGLALKSPLNRNISY